jgi:hypothetical protein
MQALKSPPSPAVALPVAVGAVVSVLVPGGSAQLVKVRTAALISAPTKVNVFFT